MKLISHRGNINGPLPERENRLAYLYEAIKLGYEVEADVWYDDGWWLGHDKPQVKCNDIELHDFWCHAKNEEALERLVEIPTIHCFWHQNDYYTLTSKGHIWVYPGRKLLVGSICVLPEQGYQGHLKMCNGICSDYISTYDTFK